MSDQGAAEDPRALTLAVLCDALRTRDVSALGAVLSDGVRWQNCRTRADVLDALRERLAIAAPELLDARLAGARAVLRIGLTGHAGERWFALALDDDGLICELREYFTEATLEHDAALLAAGPPAAPSPGVSGLVPFVHVADMARSLAFYALLGLKPFSTFEPGCGIVWAFLAGRDGARIMLALADAPIDHREQAVLLHLYTDDLASLRDHLVGHGIAAGEIFDGTPAPKRQLRLDDPDGYVLMIAEIEPDA